jgi:hypothetical protein|tara:strand:- start:1228 stop:2808 length:1581 start_codon:yes stop_codon:yes gene_type:complete
MKFKKLTEEQIAYIKEVHADTDTSWVDRMETLQKFTGKDEREVRRWIQKLGFSKPVDKVSPQFEAAQNKKVDKRKKKFIITWAQNDTPVHTKFLKNLEAYAAHLKADIHVIAGRYRNPTSVFMDVKHDNWAKQVEPYLDANRHDVHKYLSIISDIKMQPTAVNPFTGMQGISGINSCVFGAPNLQMETIPVLEGQRPKMMLTTGSCTKANYTDSKAGKKAEFNHTIGCVVVEIQDEEIFHTRQVSATSNGDFCDLYNRVQHVKGVSTVTKIKQIEACILGDLHVGHHDPAVIDKTFDLFKKLKPKNVILHDVFDGHSISHHELKDPIAQYHHDLDGTNSLKGEVDEMMEVLERFRTHNVTIVRSNHDDFVDRWIKNSDWRKTPSPRNSLEYMKYTALLLERKAPHGVIPYLIKEIFPKWRTLGVSDSFKVGDWELGQHGDHGANGSRGSLLQFRKLNTKIVVGHYHSPGRKDGALAVGTSTHLRVGYNIGASGWLQSHVIIHEDGKAQHINFIGNDTSSLQFTTLK